MRKWISDIFYSFPIQLVLLHFRNNLLLILTWILLALAMSGQLGSLFGLKYLFLTPEYLGQVNALSYLFLGFAFGGFFMTWNLTTYLLDAFHFPFLASLGRPFTKFCLNNLLIPLGFMGLYFFHTINFQSYYEYWDNWLIFQHILGFLFGFVLMIILSAIYFTLTNKDIRNFDGVEDKSEDKTSRRDRYLIAVERIKAGATLWRVDTYLNESLEPRLVRSVAHYDARLLLGVFKQNHFNALVVQLFGLVILIVLGFLIDNSYFRIPAGASIFILASIFVAIAGAITYWFDKWRITVFVLLLFGINFVTSYDIFNHKNKGYGLDYTGKTVPYSYETLEKMSSGTEIIKDQLATEMILNNWHERMLDRGIRKPKMVILCVSGGGMKAATWTMQVLQRTDSISGGRLFEHAQLITGASGGLIGTAYLRELYLRKQLKEPINIYDRQYIDNISTDLLNSVAFTIVTNDLFLPWGKFELDGYVYRKDRGYIFEKQLNENTEQVLNKTIGDYKEVEAQALIPMLFITPSIVNDGRRLIISPQGVSYMTVAPIGVEKRYTVEIDALDFGYLFENQNAQNLRFTSALRMNATYPYVLPNVYLPSSPGLEVMDAGFRDNFGIASATRFVHVFRDWIQANTSGVVLLQISSQNKIEEIDPRDNKGMIETLFHPLGIASQIMTLQDYEHDNSLGLLFDLLGRDRFEVIRFIYQPSKNNEQASVTFHLTQREKNDILNAFYLPRNQNSLDRLIEVMNWEEPQKIKTGPN
ncbi:MAG: patatin-like phospholipase family protein [Bacteroidota bacterium]